MRDAQPNGEPRLGCYLTDEVRLFYVLGTTDKTLLLENCLTGTLTRVLIEDVLADMRLVRPEVAASLA